MDSDSGLKQTLFAYAEADSACKVSPLSSETDLISKLGNLLLMVEMVETVV